ncbi:alpha/beta fold hydrolase [Marinimicrococcus flavescens]|uniref:Alpha/beta fold hydrolase n=1 Tax=Marinimicrococcus flavescens TaxID=3031815 RepID=A0AAP3XRP1_9PROT|nr:alpha/beta fold hydrolase [Marinimicrococcus flavescens]
MGRHVEFTQHRVKLPDGRRVLVAEYGRRSAVPVVYLHGFLGSRLEPLAADGLDGNVIAVDRPGYGGSDAQPLLSLRAFGEDLAATLDALGVDRCALVGVSAGAPFAVAAGAVLGRRAVRCVLASAVGSKKAIRSGGGTVRVMRGLRRGPRLVRLLAPRLLRDARRHGLDLRLVRLALRGERGCIAPAVDQAQLARALTASLREGCRRGVAGPLADLRLLTRRWDVAPDALRVPVLVLHGAADRVVPAAHAHWYGSVLPQVRVEIVPGAGHVSLVVNGAQRIMAAALGEQGPVTAP